MELALDKFTKIVDPVIKDILVSHVGKDERELVQYQVLTGGKRLRPALTIASCRMLGGKTKDALPLAAGLEILHNYTLIGDDIIDKSALRRGMPTLWAKFGKSMAECVSWAYAASVFQASARAEKPSEMTELFAKTLKQVMAGEVLDILLEQSGRKDEPYFVKNRYHRVRERDYFNMAGKKTAVLLSACCEAGGMASAAKERTLSLLRAFGFNLGLAFQIKDDILDIFGEKKKFGKIKGGDLLGRKRGNIVVLKCLEELAAKDKRIFLAILKKSKISKADLEKGIKIIEKTKAAEKAVNLAEKFVKAAKMSLAPLPKNKWRDLLFAITDFVVARSK